VRSPEREGPDAGGDVPVDAEARLDVTLLGQMVPRWST
jgi:hypothetical protein